MAALDRGYSITTETKNATRELEWLETYRSKK